MASVFRRDGHYVVKWQDHLGTWRQRRTSCVTKAEAKNLAIDLERQAERQGLGLEPLPVASAPQTFAATVECWWAEYGQRLRSTTLRGFVDKHLLSDLGPLTLREVTPARIEQLLVARERSRALSPKSINHLRGVLHRIFALAIKSGRWSDANPAAAVERRKVSKRLPAYLKQDEVPRVLAALDGRWRPLFATAVFTGMRQGELLGLRKADVDLADGTITVARSYDGPTTKGGHADLLPIAAALRPYLQAALTASRSDLVFPRADGRMQSRDVTLDEVLRRAMGRAGIVTKYLHKCRRKGCGFEEAKATDEAGRCPRCTMRLWPKAVPRHVPFHDLRHTTATLLLKSGVPLATVQLLLPHTDPG